MGVRKRLVGLAEWSDQKTVISWAKKWLSSPPPPMSLLPLLLSPPSRVPSESEVVSEVLLRVESPPSLLLETVEASPSTDLKGGTGDRELPLPSDFLWSSSCCVSVRSATDTFSVYLDAKL